MKRQDKQRRLWGWLGRFWSGTNRRRQRLSRSGLSRRAGLFRQTIRVEPLEARQLLASDAFLGLLGSNFGNRTVSYNDSLPAIASSQASPTSTASLLDALNLQSEGELNAEGESGADLVAFAKALAASGTIMYGGDWCPFCADQKRLFEDGGHHLAYVDVTNPDRTPKAIATELGITSYPTWIFPDGSRAEGVQTLATLSVRSGVAIPQSAAPSLEAIANVNVGIGSPLYVPVDAYHPGGSPLTITVTSDNPNLVTASVPSGNRSMLIQTNFGDMVFELFEDKAPRATGRVIELAQDEFYDGILFHRVIDGFMIQGGDPLGTGVGGSDLGNFNDQFHLDLQHNRSGVLSFAKSSDDTNNSQFFITDGPTRHLDFNHSIFGQLVEGDWVRQAISETAVGANDKPTRDVAMNSVTIFNDTENGLVFLKPTGNGTGTANITVTVSDGTNTTTRTFAATVVADTANGAPFLNDIPVLQATSGEAFNYTLTSQDAEGDPVVYSVESMGNVAYQLSVNSSTGVVTLIPPANFSGELQFRASVRQSPGVPTTTQDTFDSQVVTVQVASASSLGISLSPASDSGSSSTDGVTSATSLVFIITETTPGGIIEVLAGDQVVGSATANSTTTQVTVQDVSALGEGAKTFVARQRVNNEINASSTTFNVVLDRTAPATIATSAVPASANVGTEFSANLNHPEEGQGLRYSLVNMPTGMTINQATGHISWTPQQSQLGTQSFTAVFTDLAGNERQQTFTLTVGLEALVGIRLATVSTTGSPINTVAVGQQFKVRIYVDDLRTGNAEQGIFALGLDLAFDPAVVQPVASNPITRVSPYTGSPLGTVTSNAITGLGALAETTVPLGPGERLFAEVTFTAISAGNAALRSEPSSNSDTDVGMFGNDDFITPDQIQYGASNFVTGLNFQLFDDVFNFDEDSGLHTLNVLANDVPESGVVLTIVQVSTPTQGGSVTIASDGKSLLYTSAANFHGAETLTYTVQNASGAQQTANVTIQVTDINDPPVAVNDTLEVVENSAANVLDVLANDHQGVDTGAVETLTITSVTQGANGTVEIGSSGLNVRYTPATGFRGTDTFSYTISDGRGGTSTATVTVTVRPAVPPPTVVDDSFTVQEDSAAALFDVLNNDTPVGSSTLTISSVGSSPNGSTISVASSGQRISYRPAPNFAGSETITYTVTASDGGLATGRVTFNVTNVPDDPTAVSDILTVNSSSGPVTLDVLANDSDVDPGETATLVITSVTQPASGSGTIAISSNGKSLIYTPPSSQFEGNLSFNYTIADTTERTSTATVQLTVQAFTPRKIAGNVAFSTSGDYSIGAISLNLTGTDFSGSAVNRTAQVAADGSFEFSGLAPGQYQLSRPALAFLNDSGQTISVNSAIHDGDFTTDLVVSGGLQASYVNKRDFLGSTFRTSLMAAVNGDGTTQWVIAPSGNWSNLSNFGFQLNTTDLTTTAQNTATLQSLSGTVPLTSSRLSRTVNGENQLLKLRGDVADFNLTAGTTTPAEGESASTSPNANSQTLQGEGEAAPTVAETSVARVDQSAMPQPLSSNASTPLSPSAALRSLLGSNRSSGNANSHSAANTDSVLQQLHETGLDEELIDLLAASNRNGN